MKKTTLVLFFIPLFCLLPLHAQVTTPPGVVKVGTAPSGSCSQGVAGQLVTTTGAVWTCQNITAGTGTWTLLSSGGGSSSVPVTTIASSGTTQTLAFASSGDVAYDVTLSANCTFSITAPTNNGTYRKITLVIRPTSFQATLPASSGALAWSGGSAPSPSTTAITVITFGSTGVTPIFGGL